MAVVAIALFATVLPGTAAPAATSRGAASTPGPATAAARVDAARRQADALANRYFAALDRQATLGVEIARLEAQLRRDEQSSRALRARVSARALQLYMAGDTTVVAFFESSDPLDNARRDQLVSAADAVDNAVFSKLANETEQLRAKRKKLRGAQRDQQSAITKLRSAQAAMDAQLASAERELAAARAAQVAAARAARRTHAVATPTARARRTAPATTPTTASPITIPTPPLTPPSAPPPSGGGGSHHDDPFLVCTRSRESSGNYGVVNPAGPWYGAYQFSQSTWDGVANHVGRLDLVGVRPNTASVADQDALAWGLYQWQGKGPWGGLC